MLEDTREQLTDEAQSTIRNEVNTLIANGIAAMGVEVRCNTDFLRNRTKQELIHVRNRLAKRIGLSALSQSPLRPEVCQVDPTSIDLALVPDRLKELKLSGYDFDKSSIVVELLEGDERVEVTQYLAQPSKYVLTLNLSSVNGVGLSEKSDRIVVSVADNQELISDINVIQPPIPVVEPDNSQFITSLQVTSNKSKGDRCPSSMTQIPHDLNASVGGNFIYLCFAKGGSEDPITDLQITTDEDSGNRCGAGWEFYPQDLNAGAGGDYIHLCSRRNGAKPIKEIDVTIHEKSGNRCPAGWEFIDRDLNKGSGGKYIYTCFLR